MVAQTPQLPPPPLGNALAACAPPSGPSRRFFVDPGLLSEAAEVRSCYSTQSAHLDTEARSQYLFELDVFDVLIDHPLRTLDPAEASLSVLPILALASEYAGSCVGLDGNATLHHLRLRRTRYALYKAIRRTKGPFLYACTCVMQRRYYGAGLINLLALLGEQRTLIQLVKEPVRKNAVTQHQIVAPCVSPPRQYTAHRSENRLA